MNAQRVLLVVITVGAAACSDGDPGGDAGPRDTARDAVDARDAADASVDASDAAPDGAGDGSGDGRVDGRVIFDSAPPPPWPTGMVEAPWNAVTVRVQAPAPPPPDAGPDADPPPDMRAPVPSLGMAAAGMGHIAVEAKGPGLPLWLDDGFFFVEQPVSGDFDIIARVEGSRGCARPESKFGVMVRNSLESNSPYIFAGMTAGDTATVQYRGLTQDIARTLREERDYPSPLWVRITRRVDHFEAGYSRDGSNWVTQGRSITMDNPAHAGLAVAAHDPERACGAVFSNVMVRRTPTPPPADAAPTDVTAAEPDAAAPADAAGN